VAIVEAEPAELVRKDRRFSELGLDPAHYTGASHVVTLLLDHPELMQRPIVAVGDRAVIARPPERALALLETR
jgi:arsenate reductase (glutaredoxin)